MGFDCHYDKAWSNSITIYEDMTMFPQGLGGKIFEYYLTYEQIQDFQSLTVTCKEWNDSDSLSASMLTLKISLLKYNILLTDKTEKNIR